MGILHQQTFETQLSVTVNYTLMPNRQPDLLSNPRDLLEIASLAPQAKDAT